MRGPRALGLALAGVAGALGGLAIVAGCEGLATNISGGSSPDAGLLRGKPPAHANRTRHVTRLTDGIAAAPGDPWQTDLTAVLKAADASVTWDLGSEVPIRCAFIEADGDDRYALTVSSDGQTFAPLWAAEPSDERGEQPRSVCDLKGAGRYLRLSASGGDLRYGVAEVDVWSTFPKRWPPPFAMQKGTPSEDAVVTKLWVFAGLAIGWILLYRKRGPDWIKLCVAVPIGAGLSAAVYLAELWPPSFAVTWRALVALAAVVAATALKPLARKINL
jgi:hypothetical protein